MAMLESIMDELRKRGREQTRKTLVRHGSPAERTIGVTVADLKVIAKSIQGHQALACQLYDTGILEAMYLAGMVADGRQLTKKQLEAWARAAEGMVMISEYTVPWVAVESPHSRKLARKWIESKSEHIAASGWCTYAGIVAVTADEDLDLAEIEELLDTIVSTIDGAPNRVRYTMNGFVIAVGSYVKALSKKAKAVAKRLGAVSVNMGDTACKVPLATAAIEKIAAAGKVGKKRATIRC
jgi:3-methyladenine DNA glycosylase AlkD